MSYRQREGFFAWATGVFNHVGKPWHGFVSRLRPDPALAARGYHPGDRIEARVVNWLFATLFEASMRNRFLDAANFRPAGDTSPLLHRPWTVIAAAPRDPGDPTSETIVLTVETAARATIDGENWLNADAASTIFATINAAAYVATLGLWIIAGDLGGLYSRPRALPPASPWTARTSPVSSNWRAIAWDPNGAATEKVVICGSAGKIASSVNGIAWTNRTPAGSNDFRGACFGAGLYVVVGNAGRIFTSPNGQTWTARASGTAADLIFVTRDDRAGRFVAVASSGVVRVSVDGVTWSAGASISGGAVVACAHDDEGSIVAVQSAPDPMFEVGGLATAYTNALHLTTDGGATWEIAGRLGGDLVPASITWAHDLGWFVTGGTVPVLDPGPPAAIVSEGVAHRSIRL